MLAEQSLKDGDIQSAVSQLQEAVKANPSKSEYRVFLFQLLSTLGSWDRALNQLNVSGELDASTLAMVQTYREALRCEVFRTEVFAGKRSPTVFGDPAQWIALCIQALSLSANGETSKAKDLRSEAFEDVPVNSGTIDGEPFEWIADADSRIGPFFEVILNGNYYWVPMHRVQQVFIEPPEDLRDMVWLPAQFVWANGGQAVGLIPSRYPGSELSSDSAIQLARKTEWMDQGFDEFYGLGQRMFATDSNDYSLLNVREIAINSSDDSTESVSESAGSAPQE